MKPKYISFLLLAIALLSSGCASSDLSQETASNTSSLPTETITLVPALTPTFTATQLSSPTVILPTSTSTPTPTPSSTPPPTLEPEQAEEILRTLLQEPVDCAAPCFWGIIPGQTILDEAANIFTNLGLTVQGPFEYENKNFYDVEHRFESGLSISSNLTVQDGVVQNMRIYLTPEKNQPGIPREWLAYSPETLIKRYGLPTRITFFLGRTVNPTHAMLIVFEDEKMIVQYSGSDIFSIKGNLHVCPLTAQVDNIRIWMGEDPVNPPFEGVPLEEATTLSKEEFVKLLTGDPEKACFELREEAFP
jgi:hypothetical protein